jgi:hypothetical protein
VKNALMVFKPALKELTTSKVNFLMAIIPVFIGIGIYYLLGSWLYGTVWNKGQELIASYVSEGSFGTILYFYLLIGHSFLLFRL